MLPELGVTVPALNAGLTVTLVEVIADAQPVVTV
jgi:hypothetical protein